MQYKLINVILFLRVEVQELDITDFAEQFNLKLQQSVAGVRGEKAQSAIMGSSDEAYWKLRYKGGMQDILFVTTLNETQDFISKMYSLAEESGFSKSDEGIYLQPLHLGTSCHCEFSLSYDPVNEGEMTMVKGLFTKASEEFFKMGVYYSRPYGIWSKMVYDKDTQAAETLKKIKSIFDPNNIMNPGKLTIY